jgi:hypothetical protein
MNRKAHKLAIVAALVLGTGLAVFSGSLMSSLHARTKAGSDTVMYLGTIQVTPQDTPARAERNAVRYAMRTGRGRSRTADESGRSS